MIEKKTISSIKLMNLQFKKLDKKSLKRIIKKMRLIADGQIG